MVKLTSILTILSGLFSESAASTYTESFETLFVVELARHGARSANMATPAPDGYFGEGVKPGYLTDLGRAQHLRNGLSRRREYIIEKEFLSENYDPSEILSMSTFKQRCAVSGKHMLHGLYPLQDLALSQNVQHQNEENSPLRGTSYQTILDAISKNQCHADPVIQVPHREDIMMHTRNCKRVHQYLNKNEFDMPRLEKMMRQEFGDENIDLTKKQLESYFGMKAENLKDYFEMLDARVAELKQAGGGEEMINMQRQECFILANNFIGDDERYSQTYLSKMVVPFTEVLVQKLKEQCAPYDSKIKPTNLKYLIFNLHDTNISNLLRFLGYWDKHGYNNHVQFASSVRIELFEEKKTRSNFFIKRSQRCLFPDKSGLFTDIKFRIRIVYDDKEIHLPFCKELYCTVDEFKKHVETNLMADLNEADEFCKSEK